MDTEIFIILMVRLKQIERSFPDFLTNAAAQACNQYMNSTQNSDSLYDYYFNLLEVILVHYQNYNNVHHAIMRNEPLNPFAHILSNEQVEVFSPGLFKNFCQEYVDKQEKLRSSATMSNATKLESLGAY